MMPRALSNAAYWIRKRKASSFWLARLGSGLQRDESKILVPNTHTYCAHARAHMNSHRLILWIYMLGAASQGCQGRPNLTCRSSSIRAPGYPPAPLVPSSLVAPDSATAFHFWRGVTGGWRIGPLENRVRLLKIIYRLCRRMGSPCSHAGVFHQEGGRGVTITSASIRLPIHASRFSKPDDE